MNRPMIVLAALAFARPALGGDPAPADTAVRQALVRQYHVLDSADRSRDANALFAVLDTAYLPGFVALDAEGKTISRAKWMAKVQSDATLGARIRSNTGNFRIVDSQTVTYDTVIDHLTVSGTVAIADVRRRRNVGTVGRMAVGGPRRMTGEVWTETDQDHWRRTPRGWRLQSTQSLKMNAISSIAIVDPPVPSLSPEPSRH